MCSIIKTETFLLLLLRACNDITFKQILDVKKKIEEKNPGIHIELNEDSLDYTINLKPSPFEVRENSFFRSNYWDSIVDDKNFMSSVPSEVMNTIESNLKSICATG